jgi:hypothetical protein
MRLLGARMSDLVLSGVAFAGTIAAIWFVSRLFRQRWQAVLMGGMASALISFLFDLLFYFGGTTNYDSSLKATVGRALFAFGLGLIVASAIALVSRRRDRHGLRVGEAGQMGWFSSWFNKVDIGLRPRNVFEGIEVNLYPFTPRGIEWLEQNAGKFIEPQWSKRDHLMLSDLDSIGLPRVVEMLLDAGLKIRFYGRLKGWDGNPHWLHEH